MNKILPSYDDIGKKQVIFQSSSETKKTNIAVLNNDEIHSSGSTRLRGQALEEAFKKYTLKTFTGSKGLMIIANTAGYHRKGSHNSTKPRITLTCFIERKGANSKLLNNLLAIIKSKLT